jgi:hypothetical protein
MAIRRPNKPAEEFEPDELFAIDTMGSTGDSKPPAFRSEFPVDMAIRSDTGGASHEVASRLTQGNWLYSDKTDPEKATTDYADFDFSNGWSNTGTTASNYVSHMWRRAPGFFDVVTYEGNQTAREIPHNLGVAPEMMWVKCRSQIRNWTVYAEPATADYAAQLSDDGAFFTSNSSWNNTPPTSTHFTVGDGANTNFNPEPMIAYLFASVPGICDIGSYTGNGGDLDIDCGFTNGARFVLIKRTDEAGDWMYFDTVRGITVNTSNMLKLNKTDAQVANYYVKPYPLGFGLHTTGSVNSAGGTYIYYAIA